LKILILEEIRDVKEQNILGVTIFNVL